MTRPRIGLALGSGSARGWAHNKWFNENGKPDLAVLKPRRQQVHNPPGYIGIWIFGQPIKP